MPGAARCCRPTTPPRRWPGSARLVARLDPATVVALGDSFHDDGGSARLHPRDRATLRALQRGRDFVWIAGNHDPGRPHGLDGDAHGRARGRAGRRSAMSRGGRRRRDRRAPPPLGAGRRARQVGAAEVLRRRRPSPGPARLRRLCRRAQRARPRLRRAVRAGDLPRLHARRRPGLSGRPAGAPAGLDGAGFLRRGQVSARQCLPPSRDEKSGSIAGLAKGSRDHQIARAVMDSGFRRNDGEGFGSWAAVSGGQFNFRGTSRLQSRRKTTPASQPVNSASSTQARP